MSTANISILKKSSQAVNQSAGLDIKTSLNHRPCADQQLTISWQQPADLVVANNQLSNWLLDTASLTERLQSMCSRFEVAVVAHQLESPTTDEIALLNCQQDTTYIREVLLLGDGVPWVFARSVIPQVINDSELDGIGSEPLGKRIFNDPRFQRGGFQLCQIDWQLMREKLLLSQHADLMRKSTEHSATIFGRRSCFDFLDCKMSVAEVFLPDAPAYSGLR